jgi:hypothetical protein
MCASSVRFLLAFWLVVTAVACSNGGGDSDPGSGGQPQATAAPAQRVEINQPRVGTDVAVPFAVAGSANVAASPVRVRVLGPQATSICEREATVNGPAGGIGNWAVNFSFDPALAAGSAAGTPSVTLRAWTVGLGGSEEDIVMLPVTLGPAVPNILINEPRCNAAVPRSSGALAVSGVAEVFEAQLTVQLQDHEGAVLATQDVLTTNGTARSPWQATFDLANVPVAPLEVVAFSLSAEDGSMINEFRIPVMLTE